VDGRPIAFAYGLEAGGIYYDVKVGFDPGWAKFAPGVMLLRERLRQAVSNEGRRFEFLGGPEPHKLDWTETCHGLLRFQVFARTPAGLASRMAWRYGRPAARRGLALVRRSSSSSRTL
jgi:CelD/BcsL family acetyltransferase involved in cellulose biosynthesis